MNATQRQRACLVALLAALALPAGAQTPERGLPRVFYGTPPPQVFYGTPLEPAPAPGPVAPPPLAALPPQVPDTSLTIQTGPAYLPPPSYWNRPPAWLGQPERPPRQPRAQPRRTVREPGPYDSPLPDARRVGRPSDAPLRARPWPTPERPLYGRPPGS
ncbi:hypothetical protein [Roseomonas fluvialis]|nr:hypothetical protein [Roseomonas fluvialis]